MLSARGSLILPLLSTCRNLTSSMGHRMKLRGWEGLAEPVCDAAVGI
jgi:hypothetical protein